MYPHPWDKVCHVTADVDSRAGNNSPGIKFTHHNRCRSRYRTLDKVCTSQRCRGTTPLGSSSHITTDVVAGTHPWDQVRHSRCLSRYHTPGIKFARHSRCSRYHTPGIKFTHHNRCVAGTAPLGSSSHVTADVLAGTTPLGSKFARHSRCSRYHTPG